MHKFDDGFYIKTFAELDGSDENNEKLLMQGVIMGIGDIEHYSKFIVTKCGKCKDEVQYRLEDFSTWRNFKTVTECPSCGNTVDIIQHDKGMVRKFLFGEERAANPITITAFVFDNDVYNVRPGEKIKINGVIRSLKQPKTETYKRVIDIKQLSTNASKVTLPTDEEKTEFGTMDKSLLLQSFAPNIKGMELEKECLFVAMLGGVENPNTRGDVNVLLAGDPGVAKTQLLKFVVSVTEKSDYASGKSSSQAGLLAGVDNLSDGTRVAKAGSVIMCNGGICCIDEFEKMNASDRSGLHEVMENRTFSLRKIGINTTWEAKTAIFAAANPRTSRWDSNLTITENLNLPFSLLSRFGLIVLIRDIPHKENDLELARHIRKIKQTGIVSPLEPVKITKFVNHARTITPRISDEAADVIENYWIDLRCQSQAEGSILIDKRTLQDLYRLAEAYARWDLSEIVTKEHGQKAINLLGRTLRSLGMTTPGEVAKSLFDHMSKEEFLMMLFKTPISEESAIIRMREKYKWYGTEEKCLHDINALRRNGKIYESDGKLKWV